MSEMLARLLDHVETQILQKLLGKFVSEPSDASSRRDRAERLLSGTWDVDPEEVTMPWTDVTSEDIGYRILGEIKKRVRRAQGLRALEQLLQLLKTRQIGVEATTIDLLIARIHLTATLLEESIPVDHLKAARNYLSKPPPDRILEEANDWGKLALLVRAATDPSGSGLFPFLRNAMQQAGTSAEAIAQVKSAALAMGSHVDLNLDPSGWDTESSPPETLRGTAVIAVVFQRSGVNDPNAGAAQIPCRVRVLCRLPGESFKPPPDHLDPWFGVPSSASDECAEEREPFILKVDNLLSANIAQIQIWLAPRLERILEWLAGEVDQGYRQTRFEFFLPLSLLQEPVHMWNHGYPEVELIPLHQLFHPVVRVIERCQRIPIRRVMQDRIRQESFKVSWCPLPNASPTPTPVRDLCVAFANELSFDTDRETLRKYINLGTPYLVWVVGTDSEPRSSATEQLAPVVPSGHASALLAAVKAIRESATNPSSVTLVFETDESLNFLDGSTPYDVSHRG